MSGSLRHRRGDGVHAAFAVLVALPVSAVYLLLQRYIVSGLAIGGVKG